MCGTDDRTYGSVCHLEAEACRTKHPDLGLKHEGACHKENSRRKREEKEKSKAEGEQPGQQKEEGQHKDQVEEEEEAAPDGEDGNN